MTDTRYIATLLLIGLAVLLTGFVLGYFADPGDGHD